MKTFKIEPFSYQASDKYTTNYNISVETGGVTEKEDHILFDQNDDNDEYGYQAVLISKKQIPDLIKFLQSLQ